MSKLAIVLMSLLLAYGGDAGAESAAHHDLVHLTAHVGASYAINTVVYGVCTRYLGLGKVPSLIVAGATTLAIGGAYKMSEGALDGKSFGTSMFRNTVGVAASAGTILTFDF